MNVTIKLTIPWEQGTNPHERVGAALEKLRDAHRMATPENPALGGAFYDADGRQIGSYTVEFER